MTSQKLTGRAASMARRQQQLNGKATSAGTGSRRSAARGGVSATTRGTSETRGNTTTGGRQASLARRKQQSSRGKTALGPETGSPGRVRGGSDGAKSDGTGCGCGCRAEQDTSVTENAAISGAVESVAGSPRVSARARNTRMPKKTEAGRMNARLRRKKMASQGRTGAESFGKGLSSAQLLREQNPNISGRELARAMREIRSNGGAGSSATSSSSATRRRPEKSVPQTTGTQVSHSDKITGDESGLCKAITGTDYLSGEVFARFCQTDKVSGTAKVSQGSTSRGTTITTSGRLDGGSRITGDQRGNCNRVTGSEYLSSDHFKEVCAVGSQTGSARLSFSTPARGQSIAGRNAQSTPSMAAVTGTPYGDMRIAAGDTGPKRPVANERGPRSSAVTDRQIEQAPTRPASPPAQISATGPAQPGEGDFPRVMGAEPAVQGVLMPAVEPANVTGTRYEQGRISGAFALAEGRVTGTEQFRFDRRRAPAAEFEVAASSPQAQISVTGEGMETGLRITGDDWNRGDRVTGTEGLSSIRRNPTLRGPGSAMPEVQEKRNDTTPVATSKVTGGSGNSERGAVVTVSGGARA